MKENEMRQELQRLRKERSKITLEIEKIENKCQHNWVEGYTLEPIVYCDICDKEISDIYPNMKYEDTLKLIGK